MAVRSEVRGSTFDDRATASGLPRTVPGIALRDQSTLGHWFEVIGPNGKRMVLRQTDVGPAQWTGRGIDINAPAARMMGYSSDNNFPTDSAFSYRHLGETLPASVAEGLQEARTQTADAGMTSGPRTGTQRYWEQGRAAATVAGGDPEITDLTRQSGLRHVGGFEHGKPAGLIIHHTSGHEAGAMGVADVLRARGLGVQYVIDREGHISRLLPEGEKARHAGVNFYNKNWAGVEIIAEDDKDVNAKQLAAAGALIGWHSRTYGYDPLTNVKGHGEVSANKEADEGRKVVTALRSGTLNISGGKTAIAQGPKPGSAAYWDSTRAKGETQVAAKTPERTAPDYDRPTASSEPSKQVARAEPQARAPAPRAEAGPKPGSDRIGRMRPTRSRL